MVFLRRQCAYLFNCEKQLRQFSIDSFNENVYFRKKVYSRNFSVQQDTEEKYIVRSPYPDIDIPNVSFTKLIWDRHHKWKNYKAVECGISGESYTYSELLEKSKRIGRGFNDIGLKPGDVLAFIMPNMPEYIAAILGASGEGLTISSINPLYTPYEISHQIQSCNAQGIVTYPEKLKEVMEAVNSLSSAGVLPSKFKIIVTKDLAGKEHNIPSSVVQLMESKNECTSDSSNYLSTDLDKKLALIAYSSGTTGLPKGVCLSHFNVTSSIVQMAHEPISLFKSSTDKEQDVIPMVLPIFHNFGFECALDALFHGSKIVTLPKFEEKTFLSTLKNQKATVLISVPPILQFIILKPQATKEHLQHLRCILSAAAPIGEKDIQNLLKKCPADVKFVQAYGQTEGMCCVTQVPFGVKNYRSSGVPLVNSELKIIDIKTGENLPAYKEGELCYRGPNKSLGYLNNSEANKSAIDNKGWFHSGDIAYYDENNHFYIVDRLKEMIKVKGFQVAPAELEAVLRTHPHVEDVGVRGAPHEKKGEEPIGYIKVKPNSNLTPEQLTEFLSKKVAPYKLIEKFHFVESIPKSLSGKILRRQLES